MSSGLIGKHHRSRSVSFRFTAVQMLFVVFDVNDSDSLQIIDMLGDNWSRSDLPLIYYVQSTSPQSPVDISDRRHRRTNRQRNYHVQGRQRHVASAADMEDFLSRVLLDKVGAVNGNETYC